MTTDNDPTSPPDDTTTNTPTSTAECAGGAGAPTETVEPPTIAASRVHAWELEGDDTDEIDDDGTEPDDDWVDDGWVLSGYEHTWAHTLRAAWKLAIGLVLAAGLVLVVFTGFHHPPPPDSTSQATTETPDAVFLEKLSRAGLFTEQTPATAIADAHWVCRHLEMGADAGIMPALLQGDPPRSWQHARGFALTSVDVYCPEFAAQIRAATAGG